MPEVRYVGLSFLHSRGIEAVAQAVGKAALDLEGRAQAVTPVDTGTLKASIHVEGPEVRGNEATAKVSTGGEASDYAIFVHEGTGSTTPSKFIERPLLSMIPVYQRYIEDAGKQAF
jgi:HK97 gp10 family phage protein